ncbi:hypothetical protein YSA_11016 [Pseudomonas putida ND6]|uniref:Uncharacterized protein n=1 Tax=Pseudomonas putida ND6 TaxID=231023 RepID=I3V4S0_PSEPU|nr:hypothetical protein YSA_11016 [Pseudomonas putida ND6]
MTCASVYNCRAFTDLFVRRDSGLVFRAAPHALLINRPIANAAAESSRQGIDAIAERIGSQGRRWHNACGPAG